MKSNRKIILLGAIFIILLITVLVIKEAPLPSPQTNPATTPDPDETLLFDLNDLSDLYALQLLYRVDGKDFPLTLNKDASNQWFILETDDPIDQEIANALVKTATGLSSNRKLPVDENTNYAEFGFYENDLFLIQIITYSGETQSLGIGGVTPAKDRHYVVKDTQSDIYLVDARPIGFLLYYLQDIYQSP
ncbi:hypothetical protein MASR2M15_09930 [Anaerolineales bacterium]